MSKDKMIEWLEVLHKQIDVTELTKNGRIMAVDILFHEVETALEEVPEHGQWIEREDAFGDIFYDCSMCGESWSTVEGNPWNNGMNYCPHCGSYNGGKEE